MAGELESEICLCIWNSISQSLLCKDGDEDDEWDVGEEGDESHDATAETPTFSIYFSREISTRLSKSMGITHHVRPEGHLE